MEEFILPVEIVNLQNCLDLLAIIISVLIPIVVMVITLLCSHREQTRALEQQANEFKQSLREQQENTRLSAMPVFDVVEVTGSLKEFPSLRNTPRKGHFIEVRLKNSGNGTAMNPYTQWIPVENSYINHPIYENEYACYACYQDVTSDRLVAAVQQEIKITLIRKSTKNEIPALEEVILPLRFCDLLGNEYKQKIAVQFCINMDNGDVSLFALKSHIPELLVLDKKADCKNGTTDLQ